MAKEVKDVRRTKELRPRSRRKWTRLSYKNFTHIEVDSQVLNQRQWNMEPCAGQSVDMGAFSYGTGVSNLARPLADVSNML